MKKHVIATILWLAAGALHAQNFPARDVNPEEMISLTPTMPLNTALELIDSFTRRYDNRIIIDPEQRRQPIGVSVENMHWKRALEYILRSNMLKYVQHDRHYEVVPLVDRPQTAGATDEVSFTTREIEINAVFFQVDYEALRELGIDWSTLINGTVQLQAFGASQVVQEYFRVSTSAKITRRVRVDALLRMFESRSDGEVIARPQIRVMDGEEGKIKVGKNFFLTMQDFAGNTRFTEQEAGIILTVTPEIIGEGDTTFIYLDINAERSDVQPDAVGLTKNITESRTRVLLRDGEETAIAGLLSHETQTLRKGVPILKDLPWWFFGMRYVFGYESRSVKKRELVVLIEANIVPSLMSRRGDDSSIRSHLYKQKLELMRSKARVTDENLGNNGTVRRTRRSTGNGR